MIGEEGMNILRKSRVTVCGLGGVGSFAAEALCRGGIGNITLIDFDDICATNMNRQLHALETTVGMPKATVMAERMRLINRDAVITPIKEFISSENIGRLLTPPPDFLVDGIDHFTSKAALIAWCLEHGVPVVSSMGAAARRDPSKIRVADISESHGCRMARSLRKILRQQGITTGVDVVYSTEEFDRNCAREPSAEETENGFGIKKRVTLGSLSFIPPIFGMIMAGIVINRLLGKV